MRVRSHDGRVRAIVSEDVHIDVAFIGAPSSDYAGMHTIQCTRSNR